MNVAEFLGKVCVDGQPVSDVLQVTVDMEKVTIVYERQRDGADPAHRVLTVESEAVTFG